MRTLLKKSNQQKGLFKSYYCLVCKQKKPCQLLTSWDSDWKDKSLPKSYCCACYYQNEQEKVKEYSNYQQVYQQKVRKSLKEKQEQLKKCQCETSEKVRVSSDFYAWCEKCGETINVASKKRVIKNRNDPKFWGLKVKQKETILRKVW